jgi:hypothetical protein
MALPSAPTAIPLMGGAAFTPYLNPSAGRSVTDFQIMSDLHLNRSNDYRTFTIPPTASNLVLAGDIGRLQDYDDYLSFLERHVSKYSMTYFCLGNHEFHGLSYEEGIALSQRLEREPCLKGKLRLLTRETGPVETPTDAGYNSVTILGCTLWSSILESAESAVRSRVKDFTEIKNWSVEEHNRHHQEDVAWLKSEIEQVRRRDSYEPRKILCVTHYPPVMKEASAPEHANNAWNSAFGTDLLGASKDEGQAGGTNIFTEVNCWIFGHTHYSTRFEKGGLRVFSNQRGNVAPKNEEKGRLKSLADKIKGGKSEPKGPHDFDITKVIHV